MSAATPWVIHMVRKMLQAKRYATDPRTLAFNAVAGASFWSGYFTCARGTLEDWVLDRHLLNEERISS